MTDEKIIDMILLALDHTAPMFRKCGDVTIDSELKEFYEAGYFEDEECHIATENGKQFLRPFVERYENEIRSEICKKMCEEQSIRELTEKLELDKYSNGDLLVKYMLHRLSRKEKDLSIEMSEIKGDTFTVKEKPIYITSL
jgi:hypothetical protein|nr:MAG TPA: hypothetical protein [Caudoviricetes sp.]